MSCSIISMQGKIKNTEALSYRSSCLSEKLLKNCCTKFAFFHRIPSKTALKFYSQPSLQIYVDFAKIGFGIFRGVNFSFVGKGGGIDLTKNGVEKFNTSLAGFLPGFLTFSPLLLIHGQSAPKP